jgi:hypothetical protein
MGATDPFKESVLNGLNPYAQTGNPALSQRSKLWKVDRPRVDFKSDLCTGLEGEGGPAVIKDAGQL